MEFPALRPGFTPGSAVLLANDVRAEKRSPEPVAAILGPTDMPWRWEYHSQAV